MKKGRIDFKTIGNVFLCSVALAFMFVHPCAGSEDPTKFPSRAITMIIQYAPGGTSDLTGRKLADLASKTLGQPIVVENRPGGGGIIGTAAIANAAPDGYTIGLTSGSPTVFAPHLQPVPYKTKEDFSWLIQFADAVYVFAVRIDSPWKTFKEFVEEARRNPGKMSYTTPGATTGQNIFMQQIFSKEKVKVNHVPAKGGQETVLLVLGGHTESAFTSEVIPHVRGGKLRGLAVQTEKRLEQFPDIPTFLELGYKGIDPIVFVGLFAPKGLHPIIVKKLYEAFRKAAEDPSFLELLATLNLASNIKNPEDFKAAIFKYYDANAIALKKSPE